MRTTNDHQMTACNMRGQRCVGGFGPIWAVLLAVLGCSANAASPTPSQDWPLGADIDETAVTRTVYVAPDGKPDNPGTAERPTTLTKAITDAGKTVATRIVLKDGDYRQRYQVGPGDNLLIFEAENTGKARITGADVFEWKDEGRGVYSIAWDKDWGPHKAVFSGFNKEQDTAKCRKELLFVNDIRLTPRHDPATAEPIASWRLAAGEFTVDEKADKIYFRPPSFTLMKPGVVVEASVRGNNGDPSDIHQWNDVLFGIEDHSNVVIRGLVFGRSANSINCDPALHIQSPHATRNGPASAYAGNILIENCLFTQCNAAGLKLRRLRNLTLRNVTAHDNGGAGINSAALHNALAEDITLTGNGWRFGKWGSKHTTAGWKHIDGPIGTGRYPVYEWSKRVVIRRMTARGNSKGFWSDFGGAELLLDHVLIEDNDFSGLECEYTIGPITVTDSVIRRNGGRNIHGYATPNMILKDCYIYGARLSPGEHNDRWVREIPLNADDRANSGIRARVNNWIIEDCVVAATLPNSSIWSAVYWGKDPDRVFGDQDFIDTLASNNNTWHVTAISWPRPAVFLGDDSTHEADKTWQQWQATVTKSGRKLDPDSTFTNGPDKTPDLSDVPDPTVKPEGNIAPGAIPMAPVTVKDTAVTLAVLDGDFDADGDTLSIASFTQPAHGSVKQDGNMLIYTPAAGYVGGDLFYYTVTDGKASDSAMVFLSIMPDADKQAPPRLGPPVVMARPGHILVDWVKSRAPDRMGYHVYRATTPDGTYQKLTADGPLVESNYVDQHAAAGTTYYYKVTAVDTSGNESNPSLPGIKE